MDSVTFAWFAAGALATIPIMVTMSFNHRAAKARLLSEIEEKEQKHRKAKSEFGKVNEKLAEQVDDLKSALETHEKRRQNVIEALENALAAATVPAVAMNDLTATAGTVEPVHDDDATQAVALAQATGVTVSEAQRAILGAVSAFNKTSVPVGHWGEALAKAVEKAS